MARHKTKQDMSIIVLISYVLVAFLDNLSLWAGIRHKGDVK